MKTLRALLLLTPILIPNVSAGLCFRPAVQSIDAPHAGDELQNVSVCQMLEYPRDYFGVTVRLTAVYQQEFEGAHLEDERCALGTDVHLGIHFVDMGERQNKLTADAMNKIRLPEYGGRARVTVVGVLRNISRRDFQWYRYRFDIIRVEGVSHIIVPYEGTLEAGKTYRTAVRGDERFGVSPVIPVRTQEHYALRIEWTNLDDFPALQRLRGGPCEQQIVFSVINDEIKQMTADRWNRTIQCKIIQVE